LLRLANVPPNERLIRWTSSSVSGRQPFMCFSLLCRVITNNDADARI
jgi:hypothetical protein